MCQTKDQGGRRCEGALARQRDSNAFSRAEKVFEETGQVSLGFVSSQKSLDEAVANGSIVARQHKDFPELTVYDYSVTTHFARGWTDLTTECRGLIINTETGEIVARPFKKFYNNSEDDVVDNQFPRTGPIEVMEKADGSMGTLFTRPDGLMALSTRGSMNSEQAEHATNLYNEKYAGTWSPDPDYTYCFEIIYPDNRIVVDYGDKDDLVLLGARNKRTGASATREQLNAAGWTGPQVKVYEYESFSEVLETSEKGIAGEEGFVVHFTDHDKRVKIKFEEYLRLHRSLSNLTPLRVYENMRAGEKLSDNPDFPDEFYEDVEKTEKKFEETHQNNLNDVQSAHDEVKASLPENYSRKEFAMAAQKVERSSFQGRKLFSLLMLKENSQDERLDDAIWDQMKPAGNLGFTSFFNR